MAALETHIEDCRRWVGAGYETVHRWLDEFASLDGPLHRRHRHHAEGVEQARRLFGPSGGDAALVHILRDCRNIPRMGDYASGIVDPLGLPKAWPVAAYSRYTEEAFAALVQHKLHGPTGVILCGFIGQETRSLLATVSALSDERVKELAPKIESTLRYRQGLPPFERTPTVKPIANDQIRSHVQNIEAQPLFADIQKQLGSFEFGYIDTAALVTPLPLLDLDYIEALRAEVAGDDEFSIFRFAIPETVNIPVQAGVDVANRRVLITSINKTLMIGNMDVRPVPDGGFEVRFAVTNAAAVIIASRVGNRAYLRSGTHRAYLLASLGRTEIPCVVVNENQIPVLAGGYPAFSPAVLSQPRPPLLQDYFDDELTLQVPLQKTNKLIQISAQELIIPVA